MSGLPAAGKDQVFGQPLPGFTLPSIAGAAESLDDCLTGKKGAVVVFWSGVCSHCVRYDDYFNGFTDRHPDLALVAVASRHGETVEQIRRAVTDRRLRFCLVHDANGAVAREWRAQQTPRVFLMDSERRLLYRGAIDNYKYPSESDYEEYLEPAVGALLAGKPIARVEVASFGCAIQSVYYILPKPL